MLVLLATLLTSGADAADFCVPDTYTPSGVTCAGAGDFPTMLELAGDTGMGPHTIHLEPGLQVSDVSVINSGALTIQTEAGASRATFTGAGGGAGVFSISGSSADVTFRNVDFEVPSGNAVLMAGGASTLILEDVDVLDDSSSPSAFSAVNVFDSAFEARRLLMDGFDSTNRGAQLLVEGSTATVEDSTFSNGRSAGVRGGGSAYIAGGTSTFTNVLFENNEAAAGEGGGAVYVRNSSSNPVFAGCEFIDNRAVDASRGGGGMYVHDGGVEIRADSAGVPTVFVNNHSDEDGGAIQLRSASSASFVDTWFQGNHSERTGGGLDVLSGQVSLERVRFIGNSADLQAGAFRGGGTVSATEVALCDNSGVDGGAVLIAPNGTLDISRSLLARNIGDVGSGILHRGSSLILDHVTMLDNAFGQDATRAFEVENGGSGLDIRNSAFLFHDGQVLGDEAQQGTWSHNAWLDNSIDYTGDGSFQSNEVLTGDSFVNPNPACVLEALMPGSASSALVGADDANGTIGAVEFTGMDSDGDGWAGTSDCDDTDPSVFPGAPVDAILMADGIDQDCDGFEECFLDEDGDGVGGTLLPVELGTACIDEGALDQGGDCDDDDANVFPGAPLDADAVLDMVDTDCDGLEECFEDLDNDAYGSLDVIAGNGDGVCNAIDGESPNDEDCNDLSPQLSPAVDEVCDGFDNDCDGLIDDDDPLLSAQLYTEDTDGDGFGNVLEPGEAYCTPPPELGPLGDCDDNDPTTYPGAIEACPDGVDNDCDGDVDAADADYSPDPLQTWRDQDGDGFGTPLDVLEACSNNVDPGYVPPGIEDCDDSDPFISPDANELCDGVDEDCNGLVDDGLPTFPLYDDLDGDGFGDPLTQREVCELDGIGVDNGEDCDDDDPGINPDAFETCDGIDEDCDGLVDEGLDAITTYEDADGDGFGDASTAETTCEPAGDRVGVAGDCDDARSDVNPGAEEICDGVDNDCDGEGDPVCSRPTLTGCGCRSGGPPFGLLPVGVVLGLCRTRRRRNR